LGKGTHWDHVLSVLVAYRLLAPGSEWRLASAPEPVVTAVQFVDLGQPGILARHIGQGTAPKPLAVGAIGSGLSAAIGVATARNNGKVMLIEAMAASTSTSKS
jgi:hypothetical protein